jgi:hypothetical protein
MRMTNIFERPIFMNGEYFFLPRNIDVVCLSYYAAPW